jgi:hypothetical protein
VLSVVQWGWRLVRNKLSGIAQGVPTRSPPTGSGTRRHECLERADVIGYELPAIWCANFLGAAFTREDRHRRRLQKVDAIAGRYSRKAQLEERTYRPVITRDRYEAVLLDMDGVVTDTASIHACCWKTTFDEFLQKWASRNAQPFRSFDTATDYRLHVDGKPR